MGKISTEWELDTNIVNVLDNVIDRQDRVNAKFREAKNNNAFSDAGRDAAKTNSQLSTLVGTYNRLQTTIKGLKSEKAALIKLQQDLIAKENEFRRAAKYDEYERELKKVKTRLSEINGELKDAPGNVNRLGGGFTKLGTTIKAALTVSGILLLITGIAEIGKKIAEVTGSAEKFENQFTRIFNGNREAAKAYVDQLQQLADRSNFTVQELAENSAKLGSRGALQTAKEMEKLGDVANFINKDFEQLTEAMLDATNTERWQELGFKVSKEGDKMTISYGNFSKQVDATTKGATEAIKAMSEMAEVQGATAEAGETLTGKLSTLEDAFSGLLRTIGSSGKGIFVAVIDGLAQILNFAKDLIPILGEGFNGLGGAFKLLGGSLLDLLSSLNLFQNELGDTATTAETTGFYIQKYLILPINLVVSAVAGLIEVLGLLANALKLAFSALTFDTEGFNKYFSELSKGLDKLNKIDEQARNAVEEVRDPQKWLERRRAERAKENEQRMKEERELQKELERLRNKPVKPQPQSETDKKKKQKEGQQLYNELLQAEQDYQKELEKLRTESRKELQKQFDKDSQAYLDAKRKFDLEEIQAEQDKFLKLKQLAKGKAYLNKTTGKYDVKADESVKLSDEELGIFNTRRNQVETNFTKDSDKLTIDKQIERAGLLDETLDANRVKVERLKWEKILAEADRGTELYQALIEKRDRELGKLTDEIEKKYTVSKPLAALDLEQMQKENDSFSTLVKERQNKTLTQKEFEKKVEKERLDIQLEFAQKRLEVLKAYGDKTDEEVKKQLLAAQKVVDETKAQIQELDEIDTSDFYGLLGKAIGLDQEGIDDLKGKAEFFKEIVGGIFEYEQEIAEARVRQYDRLIDAKKRQLDKELEAQKQGLANNVALRQSELADLEKDRKKAVQQAKAFQVANSAIESIEQATSLVSSAANLFKFGTKLGPIGLGIAAGSVALLLTLFKAFKSKAQNETTPVEYKEGGELKGLSHSRGGMRIAGTNIYVEGGEYVTPVRQTQKYRALLDAIRTDKLQAMSPVAVLNLMGHNWAERSQNAHADLAPGQPAPLLPDSFVQQVGQFMDRAGAYYETAPTETAASLSEGVIVFKGKTDERIVKYNTGKSHD